MTCHSHRPRDSKGSRCLQSGALCARSNPRHLTLTGCVPAQCQDFCGVALSARSNPRHITLPGCGEAAGNAGGKDKTCSK